MLIWKVIIISVIVGLLIFLLWYYHKKDVNSICIVPKIKSSAKCSAIRENDDYSLYPIQMLHQKQRHEAYKLHRLKKIKNNKTKAITPPILKVPSPDIKTLMEPFCIELERISNDDVVLEMLMKIGIYDGNSKNLYTFRAIADTGSYQLVVMTDICKSSSCSTEYGVWPSTGLKQIKGNNIMSYAAGTATGNHWQAPMIPNANLGVKVKFFGMENIEGDGEWPCICGLLPAYNSNQPSFVGSVLDEMKNCERGFTIDLVNDKIYMGYIDKTGIKVKLLTLKDLDGALTISADKKMLSMPYYIVRLLGISYITDTEIKLVNFPSFAITDTGTTGIRFSTSISDEFYNLNPSEGKLRFYLEGTYLDAYIPSSTDYIGPLEQFSDKIMIIGLMGMLQRVIGYDLNEENIYIK